MYNLGLKDLVLLRLENPSVDKQYAVIDRMQRLIDTWDKDQDERWVFLSCYAMMTGNMLAAVEGGEFEDCEWVDALLHRFADYYFIALESYERGDGNTPEVWQRAFDAAQASGTHQLQSLILGVNAHINFDLVFALSDLLLPEWLGLSDEQKRSRYRDHCHVNEIIFDTIDRVQDQVIERDNPEMDVVDKLMGPLDEWLTSRLITAWREQVWQDATRLVDQPQDGERQDISAQVESRALQRTEVILGQAGISGLIDLL